jgi:hypothetical protein
MSISMVQMAVTVLNSVNKLQLNAASVKHVNVGFCSLRGGGGIFRASDIGSDVGLSTAFYFT